MFTELPKLFDRHFVIGYFFPAGVICVVAVIMAKKLDILPWLECSSIFDPLKLGIAVVWIWSVAIMLSVLNFSFIRILEGYFIVECVCFIEKICPQIGAYLRRNIRRKFDRVVYPVLQRQEQYEDSRSNGQAVQLPQNHARELATFTASYPDKNEFVLPTKFGNVFRSFEVYSRVVYGLDAIPAWPRLQVVMPAHGRELISSAKAHLDLCVNLTVGSLLLSGFAICLVLCLNSGSAWLYVAGLAVAICVFYRLSVISARQFGMCVSSAFDLYRKELALALGLDLPSTAEEEWIMWNTVSRMMIYRSPVRARELSCFRSKEKIKPTDHDRP